MATDAPISAQSALKIQKAGPTAVPKVSIGMPVYNGELYIREALDSLLAQTFTNFELIISDNASTDGTEAICNEYATSDARIRYVRHSVNRGAIVNFQFVLDEAIGEYFMWAAADDIFFTNHLDLLYNTHINGDYILVGSSQIHQELATGKRFNFRKIPASIFGNSPCEAYLRFMQLHHWDYAKACLIYGLYKRKDMPRICSTGSRGQDVGDDLLFLYETITRGSIAYLEQETWMRGERFYLHTPIRRSRFKSLARIFSYWISRMVLPLDKTLTSRAIQEHCRSVRAIYICKWGNSPRVAYKLFANELSIASLLMPLIPWANI
jgi:glycosyltransferase involved in cell wall biosynthesis